MYYHQHRSHTGYGIVYPRIILTERAIYGLFRHGSPKWTVKTGADCMLLRSVLIHSLLFFFFFSSLFILSIYLIVYNYFLLKLVAYLWKRQRWEMNEIMLI
jgi:hypothetical protein